VVEEYPIAPLLAAQALYFGIQRASSQKVSFSNKLAYCLRQARSDASLTPRAAWGSL